MDGLRLALIIAGIAVVAAVYFFSARRRRIEREAGDFDRFDAWKDDAADPLAEEAEPPGDAGAPGVLVDQDALTQRNVARPRARVPEAPAAGESPSPAVPAEPVPAASAVEQPPAAPTVAGERAPEPPAAPAPEPAAAPAPEPPAAPAPPASREPETVPEDQVPQPATRAPRTPVQGVLEGLDEVAQAPASRAEPRIGDLDGLLARQPPPSAREEPAVGRSRKPDPATGNRDPGASTEKAARAAGRAPGRGGRAGGAPSAEAAPAEGEREAVVVLHVMAPQGQRFQGPALRQAMESAGLAPGDMQLYHYRAEGQPVGSAPIFSALNAVKPGTLGPEELQELSTPGIALVLQLHDVERPSEAFDLMHRTAEAIAESLGGQLCDETRSTLTRQVLGHIRETIGDHVRRRRVAS